MAASGPARERPDPRPARLMMGAGAVAAVAVIGAGLVDYPAAVAEQPTVITGDRAAGQGRAGKPVEKRVEQRVEQPVRYVYLRPGQQAPKGAKVIREAAPAPRVVVRRVVVSSPSQPARVVARSRQSGR